MSWRKKMSEKNLRTCTWVRSVEILLAKTCSFSNLELGPISNLAEIQPRWMMFFSESVSAHRFLFFVSINHQDRMDKERTNQSEYQSLLYPCSIHSTHGYIFRRQDLIFETYFVLITIDFSDDLETIQVIATSDIFTMWLSITTCRDICEKQMCSSVQKWVWIITIWIPEDKSIKPVPITSFFLLLLCIHQ